MQPEPETELQAKPVNIKINTNKIEQDAYLTRESSTKLMFNSKMVFQSGINSSYLYLVTKQ